MIQGITLGIQGMTPLIQRQDQIANNLANINTTGYKQSGLFIGTFQKYFTNDEHEPFTNREIGPEAVYIDYSEGPMKKTGNNLDVLIKGSGFFTVMTQNGVRYTRNGNFSINSDGLLITNDGSKVLGKNGFIRLNSQGNVKINSTGEILQGNESKGSLRITDFKKPYKLLRDGTSYFRPQLPDNPVIPSTGFYIKQGFLEGSNVSPIKNMVEMIRAVRNFEADQRALQAHDQTLDKAVNSVGRIG